MQLSFFLEGEGGGRGVKSKQGALWPMGKWWTQYFAVFASTVWGLWALKKIYIYFRYCRDDCCFHQRSTSTINTIILGLRRVVCYDGSNWLIAMRGGVGLQIHSARRVGYKRKVYRFQITRAWYLSDRFHGSSSVKGAYRKLTLKESLNLVPRVLSYPSLRHFVGTGRRKPWQWGWESLSPFYLYFAYQLSSYG